MKQQSPNMAILKYRHLSFLAVATVIGTVTGTVEGLADRETTVKVSVEQVLAEALSHSFVLKSSDQDIAAAQARTLQAKAQGLPTLNLDARAGHYEGLEDSAFGPGIVIPVIDNWYGASATLSQPLYTGGRIVHQKESAAFQHGAAHHARRVAEADIRLQALTAYWHWSKTFYALETLQAAVTRMEAHTADMRHLYQAGLATDNDTLSTEVLLDQTCLRLEEAKRRDQVARARIAFLTGRDLPDNAVPDQAPAPAKPAVTTETDALAAAKTNRAEYAAHRMEMNASQALVKATGADFWPHLFLTARYEQARPNSMNFPPQDEWNDDAYAGVALSWNILDWGLTRAKVSETVARATQAGLRLAQADERITLEVREARINLQNAINQLAVAERAEKSARRNLEAATDLWTNGLARHSDVLDAHVKLTEAQYQTVAARADVVLASTALEYATGQLKGEK